MSKKHKMYTAEFKAEAIKAIEANQGNVSETARQLGISMQTLSNWNTKAKAGTLVGTKQYSPDLNALLEEIRRYLTPELFNSMYQDIMANQDQDVAEFSNLNAMVADTATENGQYVVSVRFTGTVSEDLNSLPQPFTEIWHFVKPAGSQQDWVVAGIQQA